MNLFIYSDESGVFDVKHNNYYTYGGLIFLSRQDRDIATRKYIHVEEVIKTERYPDIRELKACNISKGTRENCLDQ